MTLRYLRCEFMLLVHLVLIGSPPTVTAEDVDSHNSDYGIIIDAGSTGSRVHIFRWPKRIYRMKNPGEIMGTHMSLPEDIGSYKTSPGLSAYAGESSSEAGRSLAPLLNFAEVTIRNISRSTVLGKVPIYLGATAGLRVLPEYDIHPILESVREAFDASPFDSGYRGIARVLSGEEEGAFGWLCVNSGRPEGISSDAMATLGVVDLGGASAQISFIPRGPSVKAGLFPMHFGNFLKNGPIHLYTHSFLEFGYVTAWHQVGLRLMTRWNREPEEAKAEVKLHACLPPGMRWNVTQQVFGLSVTSDEVERTNGPVQLLGTGNFDGCMKLARDILPTQAPCFFQGECSFLSEYQPYKNGTTFAVIGEFANAYKGLGVNPSATLRERMHFLREFCRRPEKEQRVYGKAGGYSGGAASLICWIATWSLVILHHGYGFSLDGDTLDWRRADWGDATSWAKGKMIYEANFFPWYVAGDVPQSNDLPVEGGVLATVRSYQQHLAAEVDASLGRLMATVGVASFGIICFVLGNLVAWVPLVVRSRMEHSARTSQPLTRALLAEN